MHSHHETRNVHVVAHDVAEQSLGRLMEVSPTSSIPGSNISYMQMDLLDTYAI